MLQTQNRWSDFVDTMESGGEGFVDTMEDGGDMFAGLAEDAIDFFKSGTRAQGLSNGSPNKP